MEKELKELSNDDLIKLYRLIVEHQEYLSVEKEKVGEENNDRGTDS